MRETKEGPYEISVEKGIYVGDICYALSDDIYDRIWGGNGYDNGMYTSTDENGNKSQFAVVDTAYGDGDYNSDGFGGKSFGVDAGNIGIVDLKIATKNPEDLDDDGYVINDPGKYSIEYDNGTVTIKHNGEVYGTILTGEEPEDEVDEYDDDDEDEYNDDEDFDGSEDNDFSDEDDLS